MSPPAHIGFPLNLIAPLLRRIMPATIEFLPVRVEPTGMGATRWLLPVTAKSRLWQHGQFPAAQIWVSVKTGVGGLQIFPLRWVYENKLASEVDIYPEQPRYALVGESNGNELRIGDNPGYSQAEGECFISFEVKSGPVVSRSPYRLRGCFVGLPFGWELKECGQPLKWKRRYVFWGLWTRLGKRPLSGFARGADRVATSLYRLADKAARQEEAQQARVLEDYRRGITPSSNHFGLLAIEREFDVKHRARARFLIDRIRAKGVDMPDDVLPPRVVNSRQLAMLAAELIYYAMKADEQSSA